MTAVARIHEQAEPQAPAQMSSLALVQQAISSGASIEVVARVMDLHERWEATQARKDFDKALAAAKSEIKPVVRNKKGHNDKRYADFAAYAREVDPILAKHGLSYRFRTEQDGAIKVTCVLSHENGHSETNTLAGPADSSGSKNAIQAIGSTLTYLQRYTLTQALGLAASDDDDGRASEDKPVSGAAAAAINAIGQLRTKAAAEKWRKDNDGVISSLDRNDFAAVRRAYQDRMSSLGNAQ